MRDPSRAVTISSIFLLLALCNCGINGLVAGDSQADPYAIKSSAAGPSGSGFSTSGRSAGSFAAASGSLNSDASTASGSQPGSVKFLPDGITRADKLRAFLECRKECIAKCDRLVYVYSTKKEFCHDCIRQCMVAVLQQARSLGIEFSSQEERMLGDSPDDVARGDSRGRRNRRNHRNNKDQKSRRERRQRKKQLMQQQLLKNCIVH